MKITKRDNNNTQQLATTSYSPIRTMFDDFFRMPSLIDEMFNRSLMPSYSSLSADVWEEDENFFIRMALPGISKDGVEIEIDADTIRIRGSKRTEEKEDSKRKYYFKSLDTQFEQSFNLPTVVDADKAQATFKDGVLEVRLPKAEAYKPKKLTITE